MFLNKLLSIAKSPTSVNHLTSKFISVAFFYILIQPRLISDIFQKCAISSTPSICAKLEINKSNDLWNKPKNPNPVERINEKCQNNDIGRMFAVVQLCGKQFKVTAGDVILVEGFWAPTNGDELRLDKVLVAGSKDFSLIGRPILQKGLVDVQATVIEKSLSHTRTHFKKKRRKQFMRINFHRMHTTLLRINSIDLTNLVDKNQSNLDDRVVY